MTQKVTFNGKNFDLPRTNDQEWGEVVTDFLVEIASYIETLGFLGSTGPGVYGATGLRGITGLLGIEGPIGSQGATGLTTSGIQGATGLRGLDGFIGPIGATGLRGQNGLQGTAGVTGIMGFTGLLGLQGLRGQTGSQGQTGPMGFTGITGATGVQGIQGQTGSQGATGLRGFTGPLGLQGNVGGTGLPGSKGNTGVSIVGPQGQTGLIGITGLIGPTGIQGNTGIRGTTGIRGVTGLIGLTGAMGITGIIGFTGLKGNQGATGIRGVTGLGQTGPVGQTGLGMTGLQGITGMIGPQGQPGVTGLGSPGPTGPSGGPIGETGLIGFTGLQGLTGVGAQGTTGLQGTAGLQGAVGATGVGLQGTTGLQGTAGLQGSQGVTGIAGSDIYWKAGDASSIYTANRIGVGSTSLDGSDLISVSGSTGTVGLRTYGGYGAIFNTDQDAHTIFNKSGGTENNYFQFKYATNARWAIGSDNSLSGATGGNFFIGSYNGGYSTILSIKYDKSLVNSTARINTAVGYSSEGYTGISKDDATPGWIQVRGGIITGMTGTALGVTGPAGHGVTGLTGVTGLRGFTGIFGLTGLQGERGEVGLTGLRGTTGAMGTTGLIGLTGLQGTAGLGFTGLQGITGLIGPTGLSGSNGSQGQTGIRGATGPSAALGNTGVFSGGILTSAKSVMEQSGGGIPLEFYRNGNGADWAVGEDFSLNNSAGTRTVYARLFGGIKTNTAGAEYGYFSFRPVTNASLAATSALEIISLAGSMTGILKGVVNTSLEVLAGSGYPYLKLYQGSTNYWSLSNNASNKLSFAYNGTEQLSSDTSGRLTTLSTRVGYDNTAPTSANEGTLRYRASTVNSYCEMCMQTGESAGIKLYQWVAIKTNSW